MKTLNVDVNSSRSVGNNGAGFIEDGTWTGVAYGFMPGATCTVSAVTIVDADGNEGATPEWVGTSADLNAFIPAGLVGTKKGYITSLTVAGSATVYLDNIG